MNIVFFTGAGISEESGIPTFRKNENSFRLIYYYSSTSKN